MGVSGRGGLCTIVVGAYNPENVNSGPATAWGALNNIPAATFALVLLGSRAGDNSALDRHNCRWLLGESGWARECRRGCGWLGFFVFFFLSARPTADGPPFFFRPSAGAWHSTRSSSENGMPWGMDFLRFSPGHAVQPWPARPAHGGNQGLGGSSLDGPTHILWAGPCRPWGSIWFEQAVNPRDRGQGRSPRTARRASCQDGGWGPPGLARARKCRD